MVFVMNEIMTPFFNEHLLFSLVLWEIAKLWYLLKIRASLSPFDGIIETISMAFSWNIFQAYHRMFIFENNVFKGNTVTHQQISDRQTTHRQKFIDKKKKKKKKSHRQTNWPTATATSYRHDNSQTKSPIRSCIFHETTIELWLYSYN